MRRGILAHREELASLRERITRKPFDAIYEMLRKRCALILESQPITEPQWRPLWQQGFWGAAMNAARTTQGRLLDLLIAHHIDRNFAFRDRAVEELKGLIGWSSWVDPCHGDMPADLCTAEAAVAATVALDWLWEDLGEADRLRTLQAIRHKAITPYSQGVREKAFWCDCYHSWNAVVNAGCGLAALALGDEEPAADKAYHQSLANLQHFLKALGREGGWDEGIGHWGYALRYLLLLGEASARTVGDHRLLHARGMDATGLFPVYFTPHGQAAGFGGYPSVPLFGTLYLLVKHHGPRDLTWWLDTHAFHHDVGVTGWASSGLSLLFRPTDAECPKAPDLCPLKVYHEIGWAAMADCWPRPGLYAAAKTGDLSANNSRRDMNAVQLQVDGEMLLTPPAGDPNARWHFAPVPSNCEPAQARSNNTLIVAESDHQIDAQGSIVEAQSGDNYRWVACDSGNACGEAVHFVRHVVMIVQPASQKGLMLIVLDELDLPSPERVDLFWHTRGRLELSPSKMTGAITGERGAISFALAATVKCKASADPRECPRAQGEHVLSLTTGVIGRAHLLSVFSRDNITGAVALRSSRGGDVRVKVNDVELRFKSLRRRLQLDKVAAK